MIPAPPGMFPGGDRKQKPVFDWGRTVVRFNSETISDIG
jgi:hypothetical protein